MAQGTQNPQTVADRWAANLGAAVTKITAGVQSVTVNPAQAAIAAATTWQQRMQDPATLDRYRAGLSRVQLGDWQTAMTQKGIGRISSGAQAAKPKFMSFLTQFLPYVAAGAAQVRSMPNVTLEDKIARSAAMIRYNAAFRRQA